MKALTKLLISVFIIFALHITLYTLHSYAAVPHLINYQGRLTDSSNAPLNGSYNLTFRIYDAETAGSLLWEETQSGVVIQKGIFGILLGSVTNLNIPFDKPYWLEIKVGNEVLSPRQQITSAGYAIRAEEADGATVAQAVSPQGSGSNLDADKLDGKDSASTDLKPLGAWVTKSADTVYQAATDGFILGYVFSYTWGDIIIKTDSSNPPITIRAKAGSASGTTAGTFSVMSPVKKNDYYKVENTTGQTITIYWIPLGS